LGSAAVFVVAGLAIWVGIMALFAPWGYFMGGHFHPYPAWTGWGEAHAPAGDFPMFVAINPSPSSKTLGWPGFQGVLLLCTPAGERYFLGLGGYLENKHPGLDTDGQPVNFFVNNYYLLLGPRTTNNRPKFQLWGAWNNPNLVLEDRGTLASAFTPDGRAYLGPTQNQPPNGSNLSVTLAPGGWSAFQAACKGSLTAP
jgi:hypothetical protein